MVSKGLRSDVPINRDERLMRMMKLTGHKETKLFELEGYGHGMTYPAFPLLINEVQRIQKEKNSKR